ncbi:MAG: oligosaccharide flippase family protein, partial [Planctomycetes bacterium]|nr:oligosaccharide flippase family protein [Planctomycetota bacterium]
MSKLGVHVARGFAWFSMQTILGRGLGILGQLCLAALLVKDDFGLAASATAVGAFFDVGQLLGLRDVLIRRQRQLSELMSSAFWLSMAAGLFGM